MAANACVSSILLLSAEAAGVAQLIVCVRQCACTCMRLVMTAAYQQHGKTVLHHAHGVSAECSRILSSTENKQTATQHGWYFAIAGVLAGWGVCFCFKTYSCHTTFQKCCCCYVHVTSVQLCRAAIWRAHHLLFQGFGASLRRFLYLSSA
jgi:hypothetical protein